MQPKNDEYMLEPHSKKLFAVQFIRLLYSRFTTNPFGFTWQRFGGHVGGKQTPNIIVVNGIRLFKFFQHGRDGRHDDQGIPNIFFHQL